MAFPEFGFLDIFQEPGMRNPMRIYNIPDAKHRGILDPFLGKIQRNPYRNHGDWQRFRREEPGNFMPLLGKIQRDSYGNYANSLHPRREAPGILCPCWAKHKGSPIEIMKINNISGAKCRKLVGPFVGKIQRQSYDNYWN